MSSASPSALAGSGDARTQQTARMRMTRSWQPATLVVWHWLQKVSSPGPALPWWIRRFLKRTQQSSLASGTNIPLRRQPDPACWLPGLALSVPVPSLILQWRMW